MIETPLVETEWAGHRDEKLPPDITSVRWCWTIAHYEEYLHTLRWTVQTVQVEQRRGKHIAHCHHFNDPCNERCMLIDTEPAPGEGVTL